MANSKGRELDVNEVKTILNKASSLGLKEVGFTGGEPFTRRKKLVSLLSYCRNDLSLRTHLHTNGTLLRQYDIPSIKMLVDEVSIPFLGIRPATHDRITAVAGSLKTAKHCLAMLLNNDLDVTAYIVPMKKNAREIPLIVKETNMMGCLKFRILSLSPTGKARNTFETLALTSAEKERLEDELLRMRAELGVEIVAGFCSRQDFPSLGKLRGHQHCEAAENRVHIDAFGNVFPCTASSGCDLFSAGNVCKHELDLSQIWQFSPLFQLFRFLHRNPAEKCRDCLVYEGCKGGCRVVAHYLTGDIMATKPDCKSSR